MPRKSADARTQVALHDLGHITPVTPRPEQLAILLKGLNDKHAMVVSRAATLAGERALHELRGDLLYAYSRFLLDPVKRDPGCKAKQAIARALVTLECQDLDFWRAGLLYRQLEPVWGGRSDTATDVRCSCAMGLATSGHLRAVPELTGLLADPEAVVRSGAARAISCGNRHEAEAVLRLKVQLGDAESAVIGECFTALLIIEPAPSLAFVAGYLRNKDEGLREYAALALGESRIPEALPLLREAWEDAVGGESRGALIRAAALHCSDAAFAWLLDLIATGSAGYAQAAEEALGVYERNAGLLGRIQAAKAQRAH